MPKCLQLKRLRLMTSLLLVLLGLGLTAVLVGTAQRYLGNVTLPQHTLCAVNLRQTNDPKWQWQLNTSNPSKLDEFERLFARYGLPLAGTTTFDLPEIDASELEVVIHKASQIEAEGVVVEDSSLVVEDAPEFGINLKWLIDRLPEYIGRRARLTTLLAFRVGAFVYVYQGQVAGTLVEPRGEAPLGFPLNAYFMPEGSTKTMAEELPEQANPRALALRAMVAEKFIACEPPLRDWQGAWQPGSELRLTSN